MGDVQKIVGGIQYALEYLLGKPLQDTHVPNTIVLAFVLALALLLLIAVCAWCVAKLADLKEKIQQLMPRFSSEERRRAIRRRRFAEHIQIELQRLDNLENWQDFRFTELEAEVEASGRRSRFNLRANSLTGAEPRREKSLSKALRSVKERLILLEGEPGAGKSVALRHVARKLSRDASRHRHPDSIVPLYINLKEFNVAVDELDHAAVHDFVLQYVNRVNRHDVEEFLEDEFQKGLEAGSWLFLFDSFDEIPAVLSAVEPGDVVARFAEAISDFLSGMNRCKGVVATRFFRGPKTLSWPRFRILRLSHKRQRQLMRRADLARPLQETLYSSIHTASSDIRAMASNPMFLGLLCEHMRASGAFPQHSHSVFDSYFQRRLSRDQHRVEQRFGLNPQQLTETAETVAFVMTASRAIGLSPTREDLTAAMLVLGFALETDFSRRLDALEYLKLARSESDAAYGGGKSFTFAHRRFQEYFATLRVLRDASAVPIEKLLFDGRWRETAVVLLQTQPAHVTEGLLRSAQSALDSNFPATDVESNADLEWGPKLHILGILQDGFSGRSECLPAALRRRSAQIIFHAVEHGSLSDRKRAIEHAGIIPGDALENLIDSAFGSGSRWLQETAFLQLARLVSLSDRVRKHVIILLQRLLTNGQLARDHYLVRAQLQRLDERSALLPVLRLYLAIPKLDCVLHIAYFVAVDTLISVQPTVFAQIAALLVQAILILVSQRVLTTGLKPQTAYELRSLTAFMNFMCLVAFCVPSTRVAWTMCLLAIASFWAPLSIQAAALTRNLHPVVWILLPFVTIRASLRRVTLGSLGGFAALVGAVVLFWLSSDWLQRFIPRIIQLLALVTFGTLVTLLAVVCIAVAVRDCVRWVSTRRTIGSLEQPISSAALKQILARLDNFASRATVLAHVRLNQLLSPDSDSLGIVSRLATEADARFAAPSKPVATAEPRRRLQALRDCVDEIASTSLASREAGRLAFLDEVYQLREQIMSAAVAQRTDPPLPPRPTPPSRTQRHSTTAPASPAG